MKTVQHQLSWLLNQYLTISNEDDCSVSGLCFDSRKLSPGDAFFAYVGVKVDGRQFIADAIERGVAVCVVEGEIAISHQQSIPIIHIPKLSDKLSDIAARFYDYPAKKLQMIGITGTNGKSSSVHYFCQALEGIADTKSSLNSLVQPEKDASQKPGPCAMIGTLGYGPINNLKPTNLTTPDPFALQAILAEFVDQGIKTVVMEVSSHALAQHRVDAINFDIAAFTNLTHDHLDYHHTFDAYRESKQKLFENNPHAAVINADDKSGQMFIKQYADKYPIYAYSCKESHKRELSVPLIKAHSIMLTKQGCEFQISSPWGNGTVKTPLLGLFSIYNLLTTFTLLNLNSLPFQQALEALHTIKNAPGRMQCIGGAHGQPLVIVDYAHTPLALENVLVALRKHTGRRLSCVFGCGGDRDRAKRSIMGNIVERYADYVVITDDNPRSEDPKDIVAQICEGITNNKHTIVEHDRRQAIAKAIDQATADDVILIAGKGNEDHQVVGAESIPLNDMDIVNSLLNR